MTAFRGKSRATAVHSNKGISSRSIPRQITKTLVTGSAIGLIAMNSQAIDYSFNQVSGSVDTKISWGSIFRTQGQELDGDNTNDGNYNFDPGLVSNVFKATTDVEINFGEYGLFSRGTMFYDTVIMDGTNDGLQNVADGQENHGYGDGFASGVKEKAGSSVELLDFYVYYDTYVFDRPVSARLGRQVINWGEGLFFRDGINTINPADLSKLRLPGSEVKEALIPLGALYFNVGITDTFSAEAYYQFEWKSSEVEPVGTFFSTTDIFGVGANRAIAQLTTMASDLDTLDGLLPLFEAGFQVVSGEEYPFGSNGSGFATNDYYVQIAKRGRDYAPKEDGQYGFAFRYIAEELNSTEFGLYFVNYHSHVPRVTATLGNFIEDGNILTDFLGSPLVQNAVADLQIGDTDADELVKSFDEALRNFNYFSSTLYHAEYPEDIRMFGFSFNTVVGETSIAGEIAYRPNLPIFTAYEDNVLTMNLAGLASTLALEADACVNLDDPSETAFTESALAEATGGAFTGYDLIASMSGTVCAGDDVAIWDRKEVTNGSIVAIHSFGPVGLLRLDNLMNLTEVGFSHIGGLGPDDAYRSGEGNVSFVTGGEAGDYVTTDSWGYRTILIGDLNNVMPGVNLRPIISFQHDVNGNSYRTGSFAEGRKSHTLALQANYYDLEASISATEFYGDGRGNTVRDRDHASVSVKYSF